MIQSIVTETIPQIVQQSNLWIPVMVALVTGGFTAIGSVFGNKKINDINRQKYELLADKKIEVLLDSIDTELNKQLSTIIENQNEMSGKIDFNTEITENYNGRIKLVEKLNSIKKEALNWTKDKGVISELVVIKANSMTGFFEHLLNENIDDLTVNNIKLEMKAQITKVKSDWRDALDKDNIKFIRYFYDTSHNKHIDSFFVDICWLLNPRRKINDINVKRELKMICIKFFRHSLENLLASWDLYKDKNKK